MDLPLDYIICRNMYMNNINVSIHWVLEHENSPEKKNFHIILTIFTIWVVCGKQTHYSPLVS